MKRMKKALTSLITISLVISLLSGCGGSSSGSSGSNNNAGNNTGNSGFLGIGETTYTAESNFFYSADKGHSYGDGTKEYEIGDTVYMKVQFKVNSNKKKNSQVKVVLTIPNSDNFDAKYMDGQIITPEHDAVNNVTTYSLTANASETSKEQECVIQFVPNAIGEVTMTLIFDDNLDPIYDKQSTLIFVDKKDEQSEAE